MTMTDIGQAIRTLRRARGLSQTDLAISLQVSRSTIAMWESGKREPDLASLHAIADVLGVSIVTLLGHDADTDGSGDHDDELLELRQAVHDNPDLRVLFNLGRNCTPAELRQTIAIIKALKGENE